MSLASSDLKRTRVWRADLRSTGLAVAFVAIATIAGAHLFEAVGYAPCKLCLQQRYAYYIGAPLALLVALIAPSQTTLARALLLLVALLFAANAIFGAYHAGVEWGWWPGPTDCAPTGGGVSMQAGSLLQQMQTARVVNCSAAALRIFGLSLAGWNAIICAAMAAIAARGAVRAQA